MPYLGNELATQFQAFVTQTITGDGSTGYTLDRAVANGKELLVYINNVKQEEGSGKSYTASGTTITFSEAVASGDSCYLVYMGSAQQTVVPPDGSVTSAKLDTNIAVSGDLTVDTNTLFVDSSNNRVGIGTVSPSVLLDLESTSPVIRFTDSDASGTPECEVSGAGGDLVLRADRDGEKSSSLIGFEVDGSERMRIDSSGNVLVGKTSTGDYVTGFEVQPAGAIVSYRTSGVAGLFGRTDNGEIVRFTSNSAIIGKIGCVADSYPFFGTTSGGDVGMALIDEQVRPVSGENGANADDDYDLGNSAVRWRDIYTNGAVTTTSDKNEKQDIASLTAKELKVATKLSALFKTYRWKDRVVEKGDKARTHSGIIAQDIQSAFSAEGLDASNYGMFISNTWWEKEISVDAVKEDKEKGIEAKDAYTHMDIKNEKTDGYTEKTRLAVRYAELFSFIFSSIEARLTALESK